MSKFDLTMPLNGLGHSGEIGAHQPETDIGNEGMQEIYDEVEGMMLVQKKRVPKWINPRKRLPKVSGEYQLDCTRNGRRDHWMARFDAERGTFRFQKNDPPVHQAMIHMWRDFYFTEETE